MPHRNLLKFLTKLSFICLFGFGPIASYAQTHETEGKSTSLVPPTNLAGVAVSSSQINLTWTDTNTIETVYDVWTRTPSYTSYWLRATVPANTTSYQDTGLAAGTTYYYEVRARQKTNRGWNYGAFSAPISVATPASTNALPPVTLPVEVLGAAGTTATVQVNVASTLAPSVTGMWMTVHGLSYADKASVQVNNGAWVNLNNTTVMVASPGKEYGGIGGVFSSIKLTVPIAAGTVVAGTNTVRFRFNQTDGLSMGFRVLSFNFQTSTGGLAIPSTSFVQDDPNSWKPPFTDSTSIAAGQQIWRTAQLIHSPIDFTVIQARCTDCHAQDGRDLKYFNYSNLSIIERCKYHGLTPTQGQQVASYIRMLNAPNPGRPWNPPYQPGPGTDAKSLSSWAAGAGLEWVLDKDQDAVPYLFPNGITKDAIPTSGTLKMREIPIALQLLDWNHWLPTTHPKDAFGATFYNSTLNKRYNGEGSGTIPIGYVMRQALTGSNSLTYETTRGGFLMDLYRWVIDDRNQGWVGSLTNSSSTVWTPQLAEQVYSVSQWQAIKTWEMMQEFSLEGYGQTIYGAIGETRTWPNSVLFMASPFMTGIRNYNSGSLSMETLRSSYLGNAWYHTQMIVNSGNRSRGGWYPVDWGYYFSFIHNLDGITGIPSPMRLTAVNAKGSQEGDNGIGPNTANGWAPTFNSDPHILVNGEFGSCWTGIPTSTKAPVMQAFLGAWFVTAQKFTPQQYYAAGQADPNYIPNNPSGYGTFADRVWYMIPKYRAAGVDGALLNGICDWAATICPLANWASLKQ